ncbi:Multidrug efflux pump subunit AcrB [Fodinibius salinus]|uniref:Multidrug efflux pump subunit AcrB n=1 Tax=Fodinibius salinus TaxID=860790 RepID=A0A5D3YL31_9BACT|nr:efflux RND transporter permease subunit [Fodinibius salinus]TYP93401.1 Multidrug efflux pump subunit AcrB [Fodinibius salinus]
MSFKEFKISSLSIDNRTTVYLMTVLITLMGVFSYLTLPKEQFPEVQIPTFNIVTIYAGASPADVENLITRPIEQELKGIDAVDEISSVSKQATSVITIEFETSKDKLVAQQEVNDAVDKARTELPQQLTQEPSVDDINPSDQPILNVNLSGNFDIVDLKQYAKDIQDKVESLPGINEAQIVGGLEREIQINTDMAKMQATGITFPQIRQAVAQKNVTISGGGLDLGRMEHAVRVDGKVDSAKHLKNLILKNARGSDVYLKDIAEIKGGFADRESYARLGGKPVITVNVKKQGGANLIEATDRTRAAIQDMQQTTLPEGLDITYTGDRSDDTRQSVSNLFNTVIMGFLFVVVVLMFIMGVENAIYVGLAIPFSSLIAFAVMPSLGFSINIVVLFALILGLGIVVDNAIVIVENIYRYINERDYSKIEAAKRAAGEIALPVITGTITTIAPFVPLLFWGGIIGKFMVYLPITMILTLIASLVVALVINPVFAASFMEKEDGNGGKDEHNGDNKGLWISGGIFAALAGIFYLFGNWFVGNLLLFLYGLYLVERFVLKPLIAKFNESVLPRIQENYKAAISWILEGNRPWYTLGGAIAGLVMSVVLLGIVSPKVVFFSESQPNFVYIYNQMPVGTDLETTNEVTKEIEDRVYEVIGRDNPIVKSVISNVAVGAASRSDMDKTQSANKSKVSISFVDYQYRQGVSTQKILNDIRKNLRGIPSAEIVVEQEQSGPPTGKPVNIEIAGEDFDRLVSLSNKLQQYITSQNIAGIEELKSDLQVNNPEILVNIDEVKANSYNINNAQLGSQIRTALLGIPVSTFREGEDEYDITLRAQKEDRSNITRLMSMQVPTAGGMIPISAVADAKYTKSYGSINRIDLQRVVTLSSNVLEGYNANEINTQIRTALQDFEVPEGYSVALTGQQEDQAETMNFLSVALVAAVLLIFLTLVAQFNSIGKPVIIMSQVVFSLIGVFIGFATFGMNISVVLTGMGIIAVAGIVVKNGIILVDYTDILRNEGKDLREAVIEGGRVRLNPVILTAASTILGLFPLAIGLNIDFYGLFASLDPNIYFGGDSAAFWGALAWTIIFGLGFATLLTLFLVPSMYYIGVQTKRKFKEKFTG